MSRVKAYHQKVKSDRELRQDWTAYKVAAIFLLAAVIGAFAIVKVPTIKIISLSRAIEGK